MIGMANDDKFSKFLKRIDQELNEPFYSVEEMQLGIRKLFQIIDSEDRRTEKIKVCINLDQKYWEVIKLKCQLYNLKQKTELSPNAFLADHIIKGVMDEFKRYI